jgi:nitroimidazol reductase NimA-like FMN-containing flavoprotein (pyridoxamine 5'-phosphate oxidase superfamily)
MTNWRKGPADSQGTLKNPPGQEPAVPGRAGERKLEVLSPEECLALLEPGGIGRVGLMSADGIVMLPVNYAVAANTVVFRTAPDTLLAALANAPASFEIDHLDEASREGWSILVQGRAHRVAGEREVRSLEQGTRLEPWAAGARDVWVRVTPARISGRRIQQA